MGGRGEGTAHACVMGEGFGNEWVLEGGELGFGWWHGGGFERGPVEGWSIGVQKKGLTGVSVPVRGKKITETTWSIIIGVPVACRMGQGAAKTLSPPAVVRPLPVPALAPGSC